MNNSLISRILEFLRQLRRKRAWRRFTTCMAAVAVFVTTYALILPAITMGNAHPEISAEITEAMAGEEMAFHVKAEALKGRGEEVFVISMTGDNAGLSEEYVFAEDQTVEITDLSGQTVVLHREEADAETGTVNYWFELDKDTSTEFELLIADGAKIEDIARSAGFEKAVMEEEEEPVKATASDAVPVAAADEATESNAEKAATASNAAAEKTDSAAVVKASDSVAEKKEETDDDGHLADGVLLNDLDVTDETEEEASVVTATLTVKAGGGETYAKAVSDAEMSAEKRGDAALIFHWRSLTQAAMRRTFEGEGYTVTVCFDEAAAIPENAELFAEEYAADTDEYSQNMMKVDSVLYDEIASGRKILGSRIFNMELKTDDGVIIPMDSVVVAISYADEIEDARDLETRVVACGGDLPELAESVTGGEGNLRETVYTAKNLGAVAVAATGILEIRNEFESPYECSVDSLNLEEMDFSSRKLIVKTSDPSMFTVHTWVVDSWQDTYILMFRTEEETRNAFTYYVDKCEFAVPDIAMTSTANEEIQEGRTEQEVYELVGTPAAENAEEGNTAEAAEGNAEAEEETAPEGLEEQLTPLAELNELLESGGDADKEDGPVIALIDTGVNDDSVEAYTVLGGDTADENGHGDNMLAMIRSENEDAKVISIKALDETGHGQLSSVYAAISLAIEKKVDIINLSLSARGTYGNELLKSVISDAIENDIIVVASAGNDGTAASSYTPGNIEGVVTIGAVDELANLVGNSNYGSAVDYYVAAENTSLAAARFTGIISTSEKLPDYSETVNYYLDTVQVIFTEAVGYTTEGAEENGSEFLTEEEFEADADPKIEITVSKKWNVPAGTKTPDSATVILYGDGKEKKRATLKAGNKWTFTWKDLPRYTGSNLVNYTVDEVPIEGYAVTVTKEPPTVSPSGVTYANFNPNRSYDKNSGSKTQNGKWDSSSKYSGGAVRVGGKSGLTNDPENYGTFMDGMPLETITLNVNKITNANMTAQFNSSYWQRTADGQFRYLKDIPTHTGTNYVTPGAASNLKLTFKNAAIKRDGSPANLVIEYSNIKFRNRDSIEFDTKSKSYKGMKLTRSGKNPSTTGPIFFGPRSIVVQPNNTHADEFHYLMLAMSVRGKVYITETDGSPVAAGETFLFSIADLDVQDYDYKPVDGEKTKGAFRESCRNIKGAKSQAFVPQYFYTHETTDDFRRITISGTAASGTNPDGLSFIARYTDSIYTRGSGYKEESAGGGYDSGMAVLGDARNGFYFTWNGGGYNMGSSLFAGTVRDAKQKFTVTNTPDEVLKITKKIPQGVDDQGQVYSFTVSFRNSSGAVYLLPDSVINSPALKGKLTYNSGKYNYTLKLKANEFAEIPLANGYKYSIDEADGYYTAAVTRRVAGGAEEKITDPISDATMTGDTEITYTNTPKLVKLKMLKIGSGTEKKLSGAQFEVYANADCTVKAKDYSGKEFPTVITGSDGMADVGSFISGVYYLKETVAPGGYELLKEPVKVTIKGETLTYEQTGNALSDSQKGATKVTDKDGIVTYTITVTNIFGQKLPNTGGSGTLPYTLGGLALVLSAVMYVLNRRLNERRYS